MNLDKLVELKKLCDNKHNTEEDKLKYQNFVLKHINQFDSQAISLFITIEELIPEKILKERDFYSEVSKKIDILLEIPEIYKKIDFRSEIRLELLKVILDDKKLLK